MTGARILRRGPRRVNGSGPGSTPCRTAILVAVEALDETPARRHFAALIARPSPPLADAALAVAEEEYPGLDTGRYLRQLDDLAREVNARLEGRRDAATILRCLRAVLFDEARFRGNADAYYDPRNSFLNEVLDRRLGIPITLGILYMEVAARVGLTLHGVGFPGHFLVKHVAGERETFIDPFHGGEILSADDCIERLRTVSPSRVLDRSHFEAVTPRQILARMLHNLKRIYVQAGDDVRALWVVDRLVLLVPEDPVERRDRGLVEARLGGFAAAVHDLDAYLAAAPAAEDAATVRDLADHLRGRSTLLN
jgi:regulator of sirC expression with transglutaminase-like and TPR domain